MLRRHRARTGQHLGATDISDILREIYGTVAPKLFIADTKIGSRLSSAPGWTLLWAHGLTLLAALLLADLPQVLLALTT